MDIRPSDCLIGMCLPESKKSFYHNLRNFDRNDFTSTFPWQIYQWQFLATYNELKKPIRKLGARIEERFTFQSFRSAIDRREPVLILFAHWKENEIEFYDGLVAIDEIVNYIPENYNKVIDLCVCHPGPFVEKVIAKCGHCTIRFRNEKSYPIFWIHFYRTLLLELNSHPSPYKDAFEKTFYSFF